MFYAEYNSGTGMLSYSNAGHNHPVLLRSDEYFLQELDTEGLILGVKNSVLFEERRIKLISGDVLLFYTDGLTEASNSEGEMFGISGVYDHLKAHRHLSADEILDSFHSRIHEFSGSQNLQDDISFVALKII